MTEKNNGMTTTTTTATIMMMRRRRRRRRMIIIKVPFEKCYFHSKYTKALMKPRRKSRSDFMHHGDFS